MLNPIKVYQKFDEEDFYVFSGYVKSVTDRGTYNSVSFKVNSNDRGAKPLLISVRCFEQEYGVNHKQLVNDSKGRFLVILATKNFYNGKFDYIARHIVLAPKEFCASTHPIVDDIPEQVAEPEKESNQLSNNDDDDSLPF